MPKMLINGILRERPPASDGRFHRLQSPFTSHISVQPGAPFPNTPGRYHLYLSKACPWCHGVDLILTLKGLRDAFSITWMDPVTSENGWVIDQTLFDDQSGVERTRFLYEVYQRAKPDYTGPISVPVLLDKTTGQIVSTESADIMRMLQAGFPDAVGPDLRPSHLCEEIDRIAAQIQSPIREGVYRAGFAISQIAYDEAVTALFTYLDAIEETLGQHRFLAGDVLTEVDLKLFPTLLRFDPVYVTHFKTDYKRISDYVALPRYLTDIMALPGVADTVDLAHIRQHYFLSHRHINPSGIIPIGPASLRSVNAPEMRVA
ncbi:glutathione S-transferase C-terminal domain-containing protein [Ruegeria sp. R14_0]|uniref:glutathione S-transferase family protein n=1 Tax=Ruegeria sp. R14_0 TaxID=2821100 RepID=UPI001ADBC3C2|nr:glutathione S-transferase C-terminal domain-containing protein [Ruegeria sp. R14_0]MBO9447373.1 glutathione S-transferase C-terminal domain-containing protein [Ruegeria sp. R14_0]